MSVANEATPADIAKLRGRTRSKHNVDTSEAGKAARTYNGVLYASLAEKRYAMRLDWLIGQGEVRCWQRQVPVPLHGVNGSKIKLYRVDFLVTDHASQQTYVDVKGHITREFVLTKRLFEDEYPDRQLLVTR